MRLGIVVVTIGAAGLAVALHAQDKPADFIAVTGCIEPAAATGRGGAAASQPIQWTLTHVAAAVIVTTAKPAGAADAAASTAGETAPSAVAPPPASMYALDVKDNMAKMRLHQRVEIIGEVVPAAPAATGAARPRATGAAAQIPTLKVQSVAAVSPTCP